MNDPITKQITEISEIKDPEERYKRFKDFCNTDESEASKINKAYRLIPENVKNPILMACIGHSRKFGDL